MWTVVFGLSFWWKTLEKRLKGRKAHLGSQHRRLQSLCVWPIAFTSKEKKGWHAGRVMCLRKATYLTTVRKQKERKRWAPTGPPSYDEAPPPTTSQGCYHINPPFALCIPNLEQMREKVKQREVDFPELSNRSWWWRQPLGNGRVEMIIPTGEMKKTITTLAEGRLLSSNPVPRRLTPILFSAKCTIWLEAELLEMQILNFFPAIWPSITGHFK